MSSQPAQNSGGRMPSKKERRNLIDVENMAKLQLSIEDLQAYYASMDLATVERLTAQRLKPNKKISVGYVVEKFDVPVHPDGYCPYTTPGDGLCFVHSLVRSVLMYWYSVGGANQVEIWKLHFIQWMLEVLHIQPLCDLATITFSEPADGDLDVENVLIKNELFFNVVVYNVMNILVSIWNDPTFHHISPEQCRYGIPDISYALGMYQRRIIAVDGLARNLVMGILGVKRIEVVQPYTHAKNGEDVSRVTTPAHQLVTRMVNGTYRGYIIDKNDVSCIFNPFGVPLTVMIYSRNSNHYDFYLSIRTGQCAVPVCLSTDQLPACTKIITSADVPRDVVLVRRPAPAKEVTKSAESAVPVCLSTDQLPACTTILTSVDVPRDVVLVRRPASAKEVTESTELVQ